MTSLKKLNVFKSLLKRSKSKTKRRKRSLKPKAKLSKPRKKRLRKKAASPPPATSDDDRAHEAAVEAAAASLNDSIHDPAADADDESEGTPDAPPSKKQKLRISLKKKPGEKPPAARSLKIQEPAATPAPRRPIDTTNLVV